MSVINTFTAPKHLSFKLSTNDITHFFERACLICQKSRVESGGVGKTRGVAVIALDMKLLCCNKWKYRKLSTQRFYFQNFNLDLCTLILYLLCQIFCFLFVSFASNYILEIYFYKNLSNNNICILLSTFCRISL